MKTVLKPSTINKTMALVALGANEPSDVGGPDVTLRAALDTISERGIDIERVSRFYATPAYPHGSGPEFVNACAALLTPLSPDMLLAELHEIERTFGRKRAERWGARTLDLDLLAYGGEILPDEATVREWMSLPLETQMARAPEGLVLPHPRLSERGFVLIPLSDIAPDWVHPITGKTVVEMIDALPDADKADVKPL